MENALTRVVVCFFLASAVSLAVASYDDANGAPGKPMSPERSLENAINAYAAGNYKTTIAILDAALREKQSAQHAARMLLYRGLAHRRNGEPGDAIVDLTKALQRADELSAEERAAAERNRMGARGEAGIADSESVVVGAGAAPAAVTRAPLPPVIAAPVSAAAPAAPSLPQWGIVTSVKAEPPPPQPTIASSPLSTGSIIPAPKPAGTSWTGATQVRTAAMVPTAAVTAPRQPQASVVRVAATPIGSEPPLATPSPIRLQIAVLGTRNEAFALSVRLTSQYGAVFGRHRLQVTEARGEDGGTFYRLWMGPFASAAEYTEICSTLRAAAFECLRE
jgi:sporulation related protein